MNFLAGHYTQIINDNVVAIGCGATQCGNSYYMYCNYATGQMDTSKPYVSGTPCTECGQELCSNVLCHCNKICFNYGTLDTKTCTCLCQPFAIGEFCEQLTCNVTDTQLGCLTPGDTSLCQYSNTVSYCPFTCGLCSKTLIQQNIQTVAPITPVTSNFISLNSSINSTLMTINDSLITTPSSMSIVPLITPTDKQINTESHLIRNQAQMKSTCKRQYIFSKDSNGFLICTNESFVSNESNLYVSKKQVYYYKFYFQIDCNP